MPIFSYGPITYKKIIAVEGPDDDNFFDALLRHMNITDFDIRFVGGKDEFKNKLPALKNVSGFFNVDGSPFVTHLAIIRDENGDNAFASVTNILKKEQFTPPKKHGLFSNGNPKIGIFIMPGTTVKGTMLEDLCLKTVEGYPAMKCVNEFVSCASALETKPKNLSKAKAQTFLAAQPEIANSVGVGAQKSYWDFESPALEELKQFLSNLK
ncbi:hypothetical protein ES703_19135 [subsurface metagenome]